VTLQQKLAQNRLMLDLRAGKLTRRAFFKRTFEIGLTGSAATVLFESCDSSAPSSKTSNTPTGLFTLRWENEGDTNGSLAYLADKFQHMNSSAIKVAQFPGPSGTDTNGSNSAMYDDFFNKLRNGSESPDVLSLDVVWVSSFANRNWIVPLDDRWLKGERDKYLPVPLEAVNFNHRIWAAPLHTDVGILFYRTDMPDIIPGPPTTWEELKAMANAAMASKKARWGYVWQGDQYEGLVCNFIEVLSSYAGAILDAHNNIIVNSTSAQQALTEMTSWIGTISPPEIVTYEEGDAASKWLNGEAAFMRNWPNRIVQSNDARQSRIAGNFDIAPLPSGAKSCLGGWQLAINKFSKNQDAAWEFIKWMLQYDAQQYLAVQEDFPVTLQSIYKDPYVTQNNIFLPKLQPILANAQFRPVSPRYQDIAKAIELRVNQALRAPGEKTQYSPAKALQDLKKDLEQIVQPG